MSPRRPKKASQLATALIEHGSDAIALVDEAATVLYANPAAWTQRKTLEPTISAMGTPSMREAAGLA